MRLRDFKYNFLRGDGFEIGDPVGEAFGLGVFLEPAGEGALLGAILYKTP